MSFPQCLQAADALAGGDHLDVGDLPNDLKHWIRYPERRRQREPGASRVAARRRTVLRRCPRLPFRDLAKNLVAGTSCGDEPNDCANGHPHAADARLSALTAGSRVMRVSCGMSKPWPSHLYCRRTSTFDQTLAVANASARSQYDRGFDQGSARAAQELPTSGNCPPASSRRRCSRDLYKQANDHPG